MPSGLAFAHVVHTAPMGTAPVETDGAVGRSHLGQQLRVLLLRNVRGQRRARPCATQRQRAPKYAENAAHGASLSLWRSAPASRKYMRACGWIL
eukprot:scaffold1651_cov317-Pinguiococcus_pyrenoidosus.AAC.5